MPRPKLLKRAGRRPAVSHDKLLETLLNFDLFIGDEIRKERDPVWKTICKTLNDLIKPKNLYIQTIQDRNNILTYYRKIKGLKEPVIKKKKEEGLREEEEEDEEVIYDDSDNEKFRERPEDIEEFDPYEQKPKSKKSKTKKKLTFDITLTPEQWAGISPETRVQKDGREGFFLKIGWTDVFRDAIWRSQRLPCSFSFKNNKIDNFDAYVKISGHCISCNTHITIVCLTKPSPDEPVTFTVITGDSRNIPHTKRMPLKGLARVKVKEELKRKNPQQWRMEKIQMTMKEGNSVYPFLYDLPTLKRVKKDVNKEGSETQTREDVFELLPSEDDGDNEPVIHMPVTTEKDLFDCLVNIKQNTNCKDFIRSIGFNPFYVTYWSPEQIIIHNDIQTLLGTSLYLDTTTSIAQSINRPDEHNEILLSVLYTYFDDKFVPLTQALTEKHDDVFYTSWLSDWRKSGAAEQPKQVVTNMHGVIQNAVCLTFNGITFSIYNDLCLQILSGEEIPIIIPTQIKTNLAHFEYTILQWPCFSDQKPKVKEFYKRSIRFMTTIDDLNSFSEFIKFILIVSSSKIYHEECQRAAKYIIKLMLSHNFHHQANKVVNAGENIDEIEKLENRYYNDLDNTNRPIKNFIDDIRKDVNSIINSYDEDDLGTQDNDYYSPDFANRLYDLCEDFPCWTRVMRNYFNNSCNIPTLKRSKVHFRELKDSLGGLLFTVDKVLVQHCHDISTNIKVAKTALNNLTSQEILQESHTENDHQYTQQEVDSQELPIATTEEVVEQNVPVINQNETITLNNGLYDNLGPCQVVYVQNSEKENEKVKVQTNKVNFVSVINNRTENICLDFTKNFVFTSPM